MEPVLRLLFWVGALFFAYLPLVFMTGTGPDELGRLLEVTTYASHSRDVIFLAIAILAIGWIDCLEVLIALRGYAPSSYIARLLKDGAYCATVILLILIFCQLFAYVGWSGQAKDGAATLAFTTATFWFVVVAAVSAFFARIVYIATG
jgi:hypothetical protein